MRLLLILLCLSFATPSFAINHEDEEGNITTPNILDNPGEITSESWTGDETSTSGGKGQFRNDQYRTGYLGGTIVSDKAYFTDEMTPDEWQDGFELDYGVKVWSHSSNLTVPLCANTNYDCKDNFTLTLRLGDGDDVVHTFTDNEVQDYSGWKNYAYNQTIGANTFENLWTTMTLYGIDAGWVNGMYGPRFDDPFVTATYVDQTPVEIQVLEQYLTQQLLNNAPATNQMDDDFFNQVVSNVMESEEIYEMESIGDYDNINISIDITDSAGAEVVSLDMNIDSIEPEGTMYIASTDSDGGTELIEINIAEEMSDMQVDMQDMMDSGASMEEMTEMMEDVNIEVDMDNMQVEPEMSTESMTEPEPEMETTTAEPEPEMEMSEPEPEMTVMAEAETTEEPVAEEEAQEEESQEAEGEETKQTPAQAIKAKVVAAVVNQVIMKVTEAGADVEGTRVLMMNMIGADMKFAQYEQAAIPDAVMYESEIPYAVALIDPLSSIYSLGSDLMMNEMIDSQYK